MAGEKTWPEKRCMSDTDDDEEPLSKRMNVKHEVTIKTEAGEPVNGVKMEHPPGLGSRMILVTFRTTAGKSPNEVSWPISEDIIARIPKYASKLAEAKAQACSKWYLTMLDDFNVRDHYRMFDVIDYLASGTVKPINSATEVMRRKSLQHLVSVSGLACSLGVQGLVDEIGAMIAMARTLPVQTFVTVATECCATDANVDVSADSHVGSWMRTYIAAHVQELYADGVVEQGGKLAGIIMEVVMENQRK